MPNPVSPVVPGLEPYEVVWSAEGCTDLPSLRGRGPNYAVWSRWQPTPEEREQLAKGADIYVMQNTFGHPFQPTAVVVAGAEASGEKKDEVIEQLGLNEELDERIFGIRK
jgi:hypothetical protein